MAEHEESPNTFSELEQDAGAPRDEEPGVGSPGQTETARQSSTTPHAELQGLQDRYLRLAAEFENYKRLSQRDQREQARFANETLLRELLPTVDNLERALACAKDGKGTDGLVQGVELTLKQLVETLAKFGVTAVAGPGQPFDPACHQAVARLESETAPENTVVEVYQKGYFLHDRLLRAAMVAVAAPPSGDRES
jgi:molecular chaperone GrpE